MAVYMALMGLQGHLFSLLSYYVIEFEYKVCRAVRLLTHFACKLNK
jgi:hypothetical protein